MNINLITITAIFISFIGSVQVFAQKDTFFTKITTEYGTLEQQEMTTEAERLFGIHVPSKWVIKLAQSKTSEGIVYNDSPWFNNYNGIGVEFKIKPSISLGINYSIDRAILEYTDTKYAHFLQIEERWYYKMAKRNAQGKGSNNMTGRYLGLQQNIFSNQQGLGSIYAKTEYGLSARYGIQNRFKKYGFFDFSAGLSFGYVPSEFIYDVKRFTLDQALRIGLGVFDNNKEADFSGNYCNVLRCFNESKQMWKINFLGVFQASSIDRGDYNGTYAYITPNIAFEQKLGDKPFSVEVSTNLKIAGWRSIFSSNYSIRSNWVSNLANLEFRWYYNQNRRIAQGKSGNTLIGPFMAVNTDYNYILEHQKIDNRNTRRRQDEISYNLLWGYQLRVFKHGYVQFRLGGGIHNVLFENQRRELNLVGDIKVGYAF